MASDEIEYKTLMKKLKKLKRGIKTVTDEIDSFVVCSNECCKTPFKKRNAKLIRLGLSKYYSCPHCGFNNIIK